MRGGDCLKPGLGLWAWIFGVRCVQVWSILHTIPLVAPGWLQATEMCYMKSLPEDTTDGRGVYIEFGWGKVC